MRPFNSSSALSYYGKANVNPLPSLARRTSSTRGGRAIVAPASTEASHVDEDNEYSFKPSLDNPGLEFPDRRGSDVALSPGLPRRSSSRSSLGLGLKELTAIPVQPPNSSRLAPANLGGLSPLQTNPLFSYAPHGSVYGSVPKTLGPAYPPLPTEAAVATKDSDAGGGAGTYVAKMEKAIRMGFIRKVYGILTLQLLFTFGLVFLFLFNEKVKVWVKTHPGALYAAIGLNLFFLLGTAFSQCFACARRVPVNYLLLCGFTLTEAYLVGCISSTYDTNAVMLAFGITIAVVIGLTLFSFQTMVDFTTLSGVMFAAVFALFCFGILQIWFKSTIFECVYALAGCLIFSFYIIIDTQMMIGGSHSIQFDVDEYIFAALALYTDIVNLFLQLLNVFSSSS